VNGPSKDATRRSCPCCGSGRTHYQRTMRGWEVSECESCGSAFSEVVPTVQNISEVYEKLYETGGLYEHHRKEADRIQNDLARGRMVKVGWERKRFFQRCPTHCTSRLLDIGCGTGLFLVAASQAGFRVSGIEVSREAAELGQAVHGLPVRKGIIENLELPNESYDVVTAWEVLEHLCEPGKCLREILRILNTGGIFAGSVPNYGRPRLRFGEHLGPSSCPPIHMNFWDKESLEHVLKHARFANIEISWPRCTMDLLKPRRRPSLKRAVKFSRVALGLDMVESMFFMCRKERTNAYEEA